MTTDDADGETSAKRLRSVSSWTAWVSSYGHPRLSTIAHACCRCHRPASAAPMIEEDRAMLDDVTLLPVQGDEVDSAFSNDALYCESSPALSETIRALEAQRVPGVFRTWLSRHFPQEGCDCGCAEGAEHWGNLQRDAHDDPMVMVPVRTLTALAHHPDVRHNRRNRAVWAYLAQMPPDQMVALYWD